MIGVDLIAFSKLAMPRVTFEALQALGHARRALPRRADEREHVPYCAIAASSTLELW